jgi:hypothetical protein
LTLIGTKEAVLVFGRKAGVIERRQFLKEFLYFAGFLFAEFDRGHIGTLGESSIGCKLTPQTAQLLGIQLFLDRRSVTFPSAAPKGGIIDPADLPPELADQLDDRQREAGAHRRAPNIVRRMP